MSENSRSQEHEKAIRLVEYLLRMASLRTKFVRDIKDYERVLWLNDIPKLKGCFTQAGGRDEDYDSDIWVEIQNQREPELPSVPDQCADWVDKGALYNKNELPELLQEIARQDKNPAWQEGLDVPEFIARSIRISDHLIVQRLWDSYIEGRWLPWVKDHNLWESVHRVYSALFAIHQEQLRLGEEYELVLGLGLLTWQAPTGQRVCRHLIVANALLEFEARLGKFTIRPNPDGANIRCELDMLDIEEQPARAEDTAKTMLANAGDDPWERSCIEGVLETLVHSISSHGEYESTIEAKGIRATTKAIVEYAPAIILRKRSVKGLADTLKRIKGRLEQGELIPPEFGDLAEIKQENDEELTTNKTDSGGEFESEIYFPKPSNEAQRRIVAKIRESSGVLVQGPPGTGKSHTIANLICHLLAIGQRILITAKTPRALQVLEGLLPNEIRPLCINLLGSGLEEKRSLETSVGGILRNNEEWNETRSSSETERLDQKIRQLREEKAELGRRLRAIRESETLPQSIANGTYRGTAAQIAQTIKAQEKEFNWFVDAIPFDTACPVSESDLQNALGILRKLTPEKQRELKLNWPDALPLPEKFADFASAEKKAIEEERSAAQESDMLMAEHLAKFSELSIHAVQDSMTEFLNRCRKLSAFRDSWIKDAIRDVVSGSSSLWRELHRVTREVITSVMNFTSLADNTKIELAQKADMRAIFEDVKKLKAHLENGGKLGWGPFSPKIVKECAYTLKTVRLNGRPCSALPQFQTLSDVLRVYMEFEKGWGFWTGRCEKSCGPYALQLQTLKELCNALEDVLALETVIEVCRGALNQCSGLTEPLWSDESQVHRVMGSCRFAIIRLNKSRATENIQKIEEPVAALIPKGNTHPVVEELLAAIRNRDAATYARTYNKIQALNQEKLAANKGNEYIGGLRKFTPRLIEDLKRTCGENYWETRIKQILDVWHWAQTRAWLKEYIRKEDVPSLAKRVRQIEDELSTAISKIASLRAWSFCFSRLKEQHRRHMEAWQQSMRRLGKGTGKHAPRHRREAQKHLNECREAVPAWVMPLHRVWDTVDPAPGMFDVIIVDEASQCGFEALPLFYLGKKILIVGDDKQISPDAVGLPRDTVHRLMEEFLQDFRFKTSFDVESSLFDHGKLRYGTRRITLLEHFRCMPEIISFSNALCYRDTPLIPLRQYSPDRLLPLERVFLKGGYREGTNNQVINRPEADAIASKIAELCKDTKYAGKTMGVVVLQGDAQAGLIEETLLKKLSAEQMEKRRLVCGNPYSFQGDERDIMFLSMVAAPNERIGPLTKAADERRFNVAASRARDQMWLFHSATLEDLSISCLRRQLLEFFEDVKAKDICGINCEELERRAAQDNRSVIKPPQPFDSWFEVDVALELLRKDFVIVPQFEVAGKRIDLVVEGGRARMAIECDGDEFHGIDQYEQDMQRQRMLERCGWVFFRVRASQFYAEKQRALLDLWGMLEERGIFPKTRKSAHEDKEQYIPDRPHQFQEADADICVKVGNTVVYIDLDNPETEKQALITSDRSNPEWGTINVNTPIAQALLGARAGDIVEAKLPRGTFEFLIKQIKNSK
ncbi:MAG: AAA domain-containing protein [Nitrospiraceae bacterium]|nr:AAA domain-containing protein [Nitrospiraceae bacterium]